MSLPNWLQFAALFGLLLITAPPLGLYLAKVYEGAGKVPVTGSSCRWSG
jgi:K+-transporting ATPase ATPase A chain